MYPAIDHAQLLSQLKFHAMLREETKIHAKQRIFYWGKWLAVKHYGPVINITVLRGKNMLDVPERFGTLSVFSPLAERTLRACEETKLEVTVTWTTPWTVVIQDESFLVRLLRKKSTWSLLGWLVRSAMATAIGIRGARLVVHFTREKAAPRT